MVLALTLAEQLLPPLVHHGIARFIRDHDLDALALAKQNIAHGRILVAVVFHQVGLLIQLTRLRSALHQGINVRTADGDGQQTHSSQNREAPADIIRHYKGLVSFAVRQLLERSLGTVSSAENTLPRTLFSIFLLQQFAEHAESNGRLRRRAGLADHIDRNIFPLAQGNQLCQSAGADTVAAIIDIGRILRQRVVAVGLQKFNRSAGTQIRTADADYDKYIRILLDSGSGCFDAGELFFIIIDGQIHPAQKIVSQTGTAVQRIVGRLHLGSNRVVLFLMNKGIEIMRLIFQCHTLASSVDE